MKMKNWFMTLASFFVFAAVASAEGPGTADAGRVVIKVDESNALGPVKPVNGIGVPPVFGKIDTKFFRFVKDAGIPFSRLHNMGGQFGGFVFVDIANVFRDFDADENDPANYDFLFTDKLIGGLVAAGVKPIYRLGESTERYADVKAYRVVPPKDYDKWARICERVVAHYNEGWGDGLHAGIEYWEIWDEAERGVTAWTGSYGEYIRLYTTTAKYLKSKHPDIKVGGPASCGLQALAGDGAELPARSLQCARDFLRAVKKAEAPLDFFSFHSLSGLDEMLGQVAAARKFLDDEGWPELEMRLDGWQTTGDVREMGSNKHAATIGATLLALQASEVDSATLCNAQDTRSVFSPIFNAWGPVKGYYAFQSFNELRKLGNAIEATSSMKGVYVGAAAKDGKLAVMIVNTTDKAIPYEVEGVGDLPSTCRLTDGRLRFDFKEVKLPNELTPCSITVITK